MPSDDLPSCILLSVVLSVRVGGKGGLFVIFLWMKLTWVVEHKFIWFEATPSHDANSISIREICVPKSYPTTDSISRRQISETSESERSTKYPPILSGRVQELAKMADFRTSLASFTNNPKCGVDVCVAKCSHDWRKCVEKRSARRTSSFIAIWHRWIVSTALSLSTGKAFITWWKFFLCLFWHERKKRKAFNAFGSLFLSPWHQTMVEPKNEKANSFPRHNGTMTETFPSPIVMCFADKELKYLRRWITAHSLSLVSAPCYD